MKSARRMNVMVITMLVGVLTLMGGQASGEDKKERVMIGRIGSVEGQLLRYVHEEQDWVAVVKDAPFGLDDALYSDQDSRAEFIMPNNTWIRIGGNTQIQMMALKADVTEVDVASGMARFYNKGDVAVIKVTTPFGFVVAYGGTAFDVYVGDTSVEVLSIEGTIDFVHEKDGARYEVVAGDASVLANADEIAAGDGLVDADWDDWNQKMDQAWEKRVEVKGDSYEYLPSSLSYEADVFEQNGRWERVEYGGETRTMWRPTRVSSDWAPYTNGRWSVYYGDNCWIPDEPFGYTTHHYGSWVRVDSCGCWYWTPPVRRSVVRVERHYDYYDDCDCDWYPGRVAWIHSQEQVGWIPLTPTEPYYTNNYWGGLSVVVGTVANVAINVANYSYWNHAVIVNQNNFYNVNNYNNVRVTNINNTTIINNYHGAAVVNNTVINNFNTNRNRYNFTNVNVNRFPHDSVVRRIERNQGFSRQVRDVSAGAIGRDLSGFRSGRFDRSRQIDAPRVSNRLVDRRDINRPVSDLQLPQREVRQRGRQAERLSDRTLPGREGRQGRFGRGSDAGPADATGLTRERGTGFGPRGSRQDAQDAQQGRLGQGEAGRIGTRPVRPDFGRDRRGVETGGLEPGTAQGERGRLRPERPGLGRERSGPDQGLTDQGTAGQTGRSGLRPVRPGHGVVDPGGTDSGAQGQGDLGRQRVPRFGRDSQTGGADDPAQADSGRRGLRPVRPGREGQDPGAQDSSAQDLGNRGRLRPPRTGQDSQPEGVDSGVAAGTDRGRLRPVRPGSEAQTGDPAGSLRDQRRQQMLDQRQTPDQRRQPGDLQQPDTGMSRRQQMEDQRQQQMQQRQQQQETQRQQQQQERQQQMEQQRQQQMQQRQQQQETQRQQQQQQRQQQMEQQRQQQMQQRQQQQEMQRQQQQQQRQQQMEQQRQQQMQQRQQQMEQQRQQQQAVRQQQIQQQQQQRQQQQRRRGQQDPNQPN